MENFKQYDEDKAEHLYGELWSKYYELLSQHGISNPIQSKSIEAALNIKGAAVRGLLNYGLRKGILISSSGEGYWISKTRGEAYPYLHHIRERMIALQQRIALSEGIINNMPLEDIDKQFVNEDTWNVEDILKESGI